MQEKESNCSEREEISQFRHCIEHLVGRGEIHPGWWLWTKVMLAGVTRDAGLGLPVLKKRPGMSDRWRLGHGDVARCRWRA